MSDGLPLVIAGPIGLALSAAIGALWADRKSVRAEGRSDCKEQLAVERADKERLTKELKEKSAELDATKDRMLGLVLRIRSDQSIPNEFENEFPTAVRNRAELVAPQSTPPVADPHADWGANPDPSKPWDVNASTPPGGAQKPPRPRKP